MFSYPMMAPNLFLVGAAKAGTTSLASYLGAFPEVFVPHLKEPFFFTRDFGLSNVEEYRALYLSGAASKYRLDASTGYLWEEGTAERILEYAADSKFLIMLRNPVDTCYSLWAFMRRQGSEQEGFEAALARDEQALQKVERSFGYPPNYWYLRRVRYAHQVRRYTRAVPPDRLLILFFEELIDPCTRDTAFTMLHSFLELPSGSMRLPAENPASMPRSRFTRWIATARAPWLRRLVPVEARARLRNLARRLNEGGAKPEPLSPETRSHLVAELRDDVGELSDLLQVRLPWDDFV